MRGVRIWPLPLCWLSQSLSRISQKLERSVISISFCSFLPFFSWLLQTLIFQITFFHYLFLPNFLLPPLNPPHSAATHCYLNDPFGPYSTWFFLIFLFIKVSSLSSAAIYLCVEGACFLCIPSTQLRKKRDWALRIDGVVLLNLYYSL